MQLLTSTFTIIEMISNFSFEGNIFKYFSYVNHLYNPQFKDKIIPAFPIVTTAQIAIYPHNTLWNLSVAFKSWVQLPN